MSLHPMLTVILAIWAVSATVVAFVMIFAKKQDDADHEPFDDSKDLGSQ